jgi:hypothetical protein
MLALNLLIPEIYQKVIQVLDTGRLQYRHDNQLITIIGGELVDLDSWWCSCFETPSCHTVEHGEEQEAMVGQRKGVIQYDEDVLCEHLVGLYMMERHAMLDKTMVREVGLEKWVELHCSMIR